MLRFAQLCRVTALNSLNFLTSQRSKLLTNETPRCFAVLFLVLALSELVCLSALVPVDDIVYGWIEAHRSCRFDHSLGLLNEWPLHSLFLVGGLAFVGLTVLGRWTEAWQAAGVVLLGGFLCELLKTGFERARPSVLPPLAVGNSFPSGHTTGAVLVAGTLGFFLLRQRTSLLVKMGGILILFCLVTVVTWQRLYLAHHWFSDVLGSALLTSAWLCFALPSVGLFRPSRRFAVVWTGLFICYQIFYFFPSARVALPSVATTGREPLLSLSFGDDHVPLGLRGTWGAQDREAAGAITWMRRGEASVEIPLPDRQSYRMKLAVRPFLQTKAFACFPLEILVNQHLVDRLMLYQGWREYELRLDPAVVVPGINVLTFRTGTSFPAANPEQDAVAFHHLSLFAERR